MKFDECIDCPICLETFKDKDECITLDCPGRHTFHEKCFEAYLDYCLKEGIDKTCPYCRESINIG